MVDVVYLLGSVITTYIIYISNSEPNGLILALIGGLMWPLLAFVYVYYFFASTLLVLFMTVCNCIDGIGSVQLY